MATDSMLTKVGNAALGVGKFLSRGVGTLARTAVYPVWPKNWFKSWGEIWHDIKNGGRYIINKDPEEYDSPIETTKSSEYLGVQVTEQGKGKVTFLASRTLTGDILCLSSEQLDKIKDLPNVTVFREENKIVIEVDVEKITNNIKTDPKHKGKSPEEIKELVLEGIYGEVDRNLKNLAKITGGEFEVHTDRKLLYGIAEKLYREYNDKNKSSEIAVPDHKKQQTSETVVPKKPLNEPLKTTADRKWGEEVIKVGNHKVLELGHRGRL